MQHETVLEMLLLSCVSKPTSNRACSQALFSQAAMCQDAMDIKGAQDILISVHGQVLACQGKTCSRPVAGTTTSIHSGGIIANPSHLHKQASNFPLDPLQGKS